MNQAGHILIADDEETFRLSTTELLRREGYQCDCVPDAAAAAERLSGGHYDLLISDIKMPGNADLEMIRRLAQIRAGLPVILVTGYPTVRTAVESIQLPVTAYLIKPVDMSELLPLVRQSIGTYQVRRIVNANRQRLQDWSQDLENIEALMQKSPAAADAEPLNALLALTMRNLQETLLDLKRLTEVVTIADNPQAREALETSRPLKLLAAVRETINVLEKTKGSFKSKELGELRRRLEHLVQDK